jgi:oligoendopeptidase F
VVGCEKAPGAFSHPTVPSVHPYILMNYQGKLRDVMTLAHELGHGVHQVLAAPQGPLLAPFGLDATNPAFWQIGLGVIGGLIDELEALDK